MSDYYELTISSTDFDDLVWIRELVAVALQRDIEAENIITRCEHGTNILTDGIEQNQRLAYILYQLGGQDEVYEAVNKGIVDHDKWGVCEPCDTNSPFLNNTCLVCGS